MKKEFDFQGICILSLEKQAKQGRRRPGFCAGAGAPLCAIGVKDLNRTWARSSNASKRMPQIERSSSGFRFAGAALNSLGRISLPLKTPRRALPIFIALDATQADMPALLGLNALGEHSLCADAAANRLAKRVALN